MGNDFEELKRADYAIIAACVLLLLSPWIVDLIGRWIAIYGFPEDALGSASFHQQAPYQGFYGAWLQFVATLIGSAAAILTAVILLGQIQAEDRRRKEEARDRDIAFAYALRSECRQVIDQIPGLNNRIVQLVGMVGSQARVENDGEEPVVPMPLLQPIVGQVVVVRPTMPETLSQHEAVGRLGGDIAERAYWFRSKVYDASKAIDAMKDMVSYRNIALASSSATALLFGVRDELQEARRRGLILKDDIKAWLDARGMTVPTEE